jgi:hemoglobin-like flavoprotein
MTEAQLQRIADSFALIEKRMPELTAAFYVRLFAVLPEARPLFRIDIDIQSQHLAAALALIIHNLRLWDVLEPSLMDLGAGHAQVGVRPEHYPVVCRTMVDTLRQGLGPSWSTQLQADWTDVLERLSRIMMQGAIRQAGSVHDGCSQKGSSPL